MSLRERMLMVATCVAMSAAGGAGTSLLLRSEAKAAPLQDKMLKAERFVLVDAAGEVRAVLTTSKKGAPILAFTDTKGKARISLAVTDDGAPALSLCDANEKPRLALTANPRSSALTLMDEQGTVRGALSADRDAAGRLTFYDANGKDEQALRTQKLEVVDEKGKPRATLTAHTQLGVMFVMKDGKDDTRLWMACGQEGEAGLQLLDKEGRVRARLAMNQQEETVISRYGADGKEIVK